MISDPAIPELPNIVTVSAEGFVCRDRSRAILFPRTTVVAEGDDRCGLAIDYGGIAAVGYIGAMCAYCADVFILGGSGSSDLQDRTAADAAGGKLRRPNVSCGGIHGQMRFARSTPALHVVPAALTSAITEEFDLSVIHQQVQGTIGESMRDLNSLRFLRSAQNGAGSGLPSCGANQVISL